MTKKKLQNVNTFTDSFDINIEKLNDEIVVFEGLLSY